MPFRAPGAKGRLLGAHLPGAERLVETHVFLREKIKTQALNVEEGSGQGAVGQAVQGGDLEALGHGWGFTITGAGGQDGAEKSSGRLARDISPVMCTA